MKRPSVSKSCCNAASPKGWSHWFHILPYIEAQTVYNFANFDLPPIHSGRPANYNGENSVAMSIIPIYYCPSRRGGEVYGSGRFSRCDYAGCAGFYQGEMHENFGDIPAPPIGRGPRRNERTPENFGIAPQRQGIIAWSAQGAKRRLRDIINGSAYSIMASEKSLPKLRFGNDDGDNERWNNAGWDEDVIRWHFPPMSDSDPRVIVQGTPSNPTGTGTVWRRYFGSSHAGGLNAAFADGSVRFSSFNVDAKVWMYQCIIDDGVVLNNDEQ